VLQHLDKQAGGDRSNTFRRLHQIATVFLSFDEAVSHHLGTMFNLGGDYLPVFRFPPLLILDSAIGY